jgi:hypothetical protein
MGKYCDPEEVNLEIFTDLYVSGLPGYEKVVSILLCVCARACVRLASAWMAGPILFIFSIQEFIHPRSVLYKFELSRYGKGGPSHGRQNTEMLIFSKKI